MPVDSETAKSFTDLGIAGAALLIVLVLIILVFTFVKSQSKSIDKLCSKIDTLVNQNATYLITNDKDQKETIHLLTQINVLLTDMQVRIVRIDDRTYSCIGQPQKIRKTIKAKVMEETKDDTTKGKEEES
jgi:uncharacterized protein (UPF0333 family)